MMDEEMREKAEAHADFLSYLAKEISWVLVSPEHLKPTAVADLVHELTTAVWEHAVGHEQERVAALEKGGDAETCDVGAGGEEELLDKIISTLMLGSAVKDRRHHRPKACRIISLINAQPLCCPDCGRAFRRGSA